MIIGHLLSSTNIRASRNQIRESIVRVDPFGRAQRSCRRLIRHDYGCVDGCSRVITYMRLNNNNTAFTALDSYQYGVTEYQMPDRIRGDGGRENVLICEDILRRRGMDRGSFIIVSSKFNTCIERMWRDLRRVVIQFYMDLFSSPEREGIDISSSYHMMALQYLFIPRIQQEIDQFRLNWNAHPMRTRHNRSPNQLLILYSEITAPPYDYNNIDDVIDDDLIDNDEVDDNHVIVNPIVCPLTSSYNSSLIVFFT